MDKCRYCELGNVLAWIVKASLHWSAYFAILIKLIEFVGYMILGNFKN